MVVVTRIETVTEHVPGGLGTTVVTPLGSVVVAPVDPGARTALN